MQETPLQKLDNALVDAQKKVRFRLEECLNRASVKYKPYKKFYVGWGKPLARVFSEMADNVNFAQALRKNGHICGVQLSYPMGVDGRQFSSDDKASLKDRFRELHNLGLEYNIFVGIDGFDPEQKDTTFIEGLGRPCGWGNTVVVSVDTSKPYSLTTHPDYNADDIGPLTSKLNSFQRPAACQ